MINQQRLSEEFSRLASINSPPLKESAIAFYLAEKCGLGRYGQLLVGRDPKVTEFTQGAYESLFCPARQRSKPASYCFP